jgi:hypothetical protein
MLEPDAGPGGNFLKPKMARAWDGKRPRWKSETQRGLE